MISLHLRHSFEIRSQSPEKLLISAVRMMSLLFRTIEEYCFLHLCQKHNKQRTILRELGPIKERGGGNT